MVLTRAAARISRSRDSSRQIGLSRLLGTLALLTCVALTVPAAAGANGATITSAEVNAGQLEVAGATNRATDVLVFVAGDSYTIFDAAGPVSPGPGCSSPGDPRTVSCDAMGVTGVHLVGASLYDRFRLGGTTAPATLDGGGGNDVLLGNDGTETILGGYGDDFINGGAGSDSLDGGAGADALNGGAGNGDVVTYASRTSPTIVTVDAANNDGEDTVPNGATNAEEGDNVQPDVEQVIGGSGPDRLVGNADANTLSGGPGADLLQGKNGDDVLSGGNEGYSYPVVSDVIEGGYGNDQLDGGAGYDELNGDANDDYLNAADHETDARVACGTGTDSADADLGFEYGVSGCETLIWH